MARQRDDDHDRLTRLLAGDHLVEPPAGTLRKAIALGARLGERRAGGVVDWICRLVFDSAAQPLPAGVRGTALADRRMLFRLEPGSGATDRGCDLDLLVRNADGRRVVLLGQLLPPVADATVRARAGRGRAEAPVSAAGDFELELSASRGQPIEVEVEAPGLGRVTVGPIAPPDADR
ncbi:MAG: hypothetical protein Kow0062_17180 [Acidobacteriota bacterium]